MKLNPQITQEMLKSIRSLRAFAVSLCGRTDLAGVSVEEALAQGIGSKEHTVDPPGFQSRGVSRSGGRFAQQGRSLGEVWRHPLTTRLTRQEPINARLQLQRSPTRLCCAFGRYRPD